MKKLILFCFTIVSFHFLSAQDHSHFGSKPIIFPDIEGYLTLKTDLHMHTVFSDGDVWPTIRVQEALRENLDAISLTEHLEYQPHADDIPHPNRNRAHEIALEEAKEHDLLIIRGSEITRSEPVGHNNAVFISDANKLLKDKPEQAFSEAKKQGAFVFWNHPAWHRQSPTGNPILSDFQLKRINNNELHGIEVINYFDYSKESLALALEQNLTIMGTSDIHGLIDWDYTEKGNHRPLTLVFAKKKSTASLKEALFAGRTVAVYNSLFVGKPEYLEPLLKASIKINSAQYEEDTQVLVIEIENATSSDLLFENAMPFSFYSKAPIFTVAAGKKEKLQIKTITELKEFKLQLTALGAYSAPEIHPVITWDISVEK
ncbi:PHP domain-containing protein [Kriegella sp. EG-1]|nr:PHP domain-containing protein [Flavobacteriaceae bacterium EG-1]